ncbi:hypothetical protein [Xanthomonas sacchari]|uniref:hypothetical protein n=1 Tax=Xanthomonas sacchari TaxID=56458 RepID=UPI00224F57A6|nr:hypothetical protein [Xanthomonas sacchari]
MAFGSSPPIEVLPISFYGKCRSFHAGLVAKGDWMQVWEGVRQCLTAVKSSDKFWDALSAVGTLLAVVVALWVSGKETRRHKRERKEKAEWLRQELLEPIHRWHIAARGAFGLVELGQDHNLQQLLCKEADARYPFAVPGIVRDLRPALHDLGKTGVQLAKAVGIARRIKRCDILGVLRKQYNNHNEDLSIRAEFREGLQELVELLSRIEKNLGGNDLKARPRHVRRRWMLFRE